MLTRMYIHNYKCFQNFEVDFEKVHDAAIIGRNGTGKTTIACVLDILRRIGGGESDVNGLVGIEDFWHASPGELLRIEVSFRIEADSYAYSFALEFPEGFKKLRVAEESLVVNGERILTRDRAQVTLVTRSGGESRFANDWHEFVLPRIFIQEGVTVKAVKVARDFLSEILVLCPVPDDMGGAAPSDDGRSLFPRGTNFEAWLCRQITAIPDIYENMKIWLKSLRSMLDFDGFTTTDGRVLVRFKADGKIENQPFRWLSNGEKVFFLAAAVMAVNDCREHPILCFWDEPDNYLSLSEIGNVMASLRYSFSSRGQLVVTSHSDEAISKFPDDGVFHLLRKSHLEPTHPMQSVAQRKKDLRLDGEKGMLLLTGDLEG